MSQEEQTNMDKKCKCSKFRIINTVLMTAVLVSTITSAYYSYNTNRILGNIISGVQPAAARAVPTSKESITKKYAKNNTMEKAQKSGKPIVAFFYADWCGYCKQFAPVFAKVVKNKQIKSNMAVAYINCEAPENAHFVEEYKIIGLPTVYLIDNQSEIKEVVDNKELFAPTAEKDLVNRFLKFTENR